MVSSPTTTEYVKTRPKKKKIKSDIWNLKKEKKWSFTGDVFVYQENLKVNYTILNNERGGLDAKSTEQNKSSIFNGN